MDITADVPLGMDSTLKLKVEMSLSQAVGWRDEGGKKQRALMLSLRHDSQKLSHDSSSCWDPSVLNSPSSDPSSLQGKLESVVSNLDGHVCSQKSGALSS